LKLLYFTDSHIRGTPPKNRKDDFLETLENKFKEIIHISKLEDTDYILIGGDLFDRPDISISIAGKFANLLNKFKIPIYMVSGNHDIYGHNPKTLNRSLLGLLKNVGLLNIVEAGEKIVLKKDNIKVQLTGQPYIYDIDNTENKHYYIVDSLVADVDYAIHLVHGMLLDKPFIEGIPYTLVNDIKSTKADITISGHYHSGFNTINYDGKYFINPGSIVRVSNSLNELERRPKLLIIELKDKIDIKYIELKSAKKGIDVLDRSQIETNIYKREQLFEFKQTIDSVSNFDKMDINDLLIKVSNMSGISEDIKEEALRRIANVQIKGFNGD